MACSTSGVLICYRLVRPCCGLYRRDHTRSDSLIRATTAARFIYAFAFCILALGNVAANCIRLSRALSLRNEIVISLLAYFLRCSGKINILIKKLFSSKVFEKFQENMTFVHACKLGLQTFLFLLASERIIFKYLQLFSEFSTCILLHFYKQQEFARKLLKYFDSRNNIDSHFSKNIFCYLVCRLLYLG